MATDLQNLDMEKIKTLTKRHASKLIGAAVGVSSVVIVLVTWSLLTSRPDAVYPMTCGGRARGAEGEGGGECVVAGAGQSCTGDTCPWHLVISDLTNRLHLMEAAFKEQVLARELMAQEVSNQSDSNMAVEHKITAFLRRLDEVETMVRRVELRLHELTARLHSDEFIGFVVIVAIMVEVLLRVRPRVGHFRPWGTDMMQRYRRWSQGGPEVTITTPSSSSSSSASSNLSVAAASASGSPIRANNNSSAASCSSSVAGMTSRVDGRVTSSESGADHPPPPLPHPHHGHHGNGAAPQVVKSAHANGVSFSPKHGLFLKPELCVIAFRKDHSALTSFIDTTLRHFDDVKLSVKPYYVIESHEHLRQCPRAKLYLVIFEMEERVSSGPVNQDSDLITATVRYVKSLRANLILIVTNDEGSRKLTVHALYNTHLRLLHSHEAFQDLTSAGRVFSAWRELTSHQTSHMRKIVRTALNLKTSIR